MSQEKVDRRKMEKANRKAIMKKEKLKNIAARIAGSVVCLALIGWIGYSAYSSITKNAAVSQTDINLDAIENYMGGLESSDAGE